MTGTLESRHLKRRVRDPTSVSEMAGYPLEQVRALLLQLPNYCSWSGNPLTKDPWY